MRPELFEYNYDWMLWSSTHAAALTANCSAKEIARMMPYAPYFRGTMEPILGLGAPGKRFMEMLDKYFLNILNAHGEGRKIAMSTFCFSPAIFFAMDIAPVTLELLTSLSSVMWKRGTTDFMDYCVELGFTETSCSSQRGCLGAILAGLSEKPDLIAVDTAGVCDTNANAFAFARAYMDIPFYSLNYPASLTDENVQKYHREDYRALVRFLEEQTGKKLDEDRLRAVLDEIQRQEAVVAEIEELQRLKPSPLPLPYNFLIYAGRFFFAGQPEFTDLLKSMADVVRENARAGRSGISSGVEKARAFFFYIDHYALNLGLWNWLDQHNITHLGNILSRNFDPGMPYLKGMEASAYGINTKNLDSMIDSIASINSRLPMVRSIRGPYDRPNMWLEESVALAKMYKADCMIYNGTPGCRNTWANVKLIARDFENMGFPTHIMNGDAFDDRVESWEATAARLDEFFKIRGLL